MSDTPNEGAQLRIYCICGQKMKVSESMFGRPGKCVACRQKIRIPRPEDLPEGITEVHLRDHPEFLRRTAVPALAEAAQDDDGAVELGQENAEPVDATPLDVLEPLRVLCSLEYKLRGALDEAAERHDDRTALLACEEKLGRLRSGLEEQLRRDLIETGGDLTAVKERIADTVMAFRLGDRDAAGFREEVDRLRRQREALERRRQNLRGWLMVSDPHAAGGYLSVPFEEIPEPGAAPHYPPAVQTEKGLVAHYTETLGEALRSREHLDRKLEEWARVAENGGMSSADLAWANAGCGAEWRRARGTAAFARDRLGQCVQDCKLDLLAVAARRAAPAGPPDPGLDRLETDRLRAKEAALAARRAARGGDLPAKGGTLLGRLARPKAVPGFGVDAALAWVAGVLLVACIAAPFSAAQAAGDLLAMRGLVLGLFLTATAWALAGAIPTRPARGVLIAIVFVGGVLGGAVYLDRTWYGTGAVGEAMRTDPRWFLAPGIVLSAVASLFMGVAAVVSLAPFRRLRWLGVGAAALAVLAVAGLFTNAAGLADPRPVLLPREESAADERGVRPVTFRIENRGWRPIWVSARETADPARAVFAVERRTEEGSWTLVGRSTAAQRAGTPAWLPVGRQAVPADRIDHGGVREYHYELPPGEYRAVLLANVSGPERQEQTFTLAGAAAPVPRTEDPLVQAPAPGPTAHIDQVRARLRGVVDGSGRAPLFNVNIELPGGETRAQRVTLGGVLFDAWVAEEYNPDRQTLTVNDGQRRMVLQTGEWVNLPVAREALETVPSP